MEWLYTNEKERSQIERELKNQFQMAGMALNLNGMIQDNIHNRAGEFTFYNMIENKYSNVEKLIRGRSYNIVVISQEIEYSDSMLWNIHPHIKDGESWRVLFLNQYDEDNQDNKAIAKL